jgi:hypothetical protein
VTKGLKTARAKVKTAKTDLKEAKGQDIVDAKKEELAQAEQEKLEAQQEYTEANVAYEQKLRVFEAYTAQLNTGASPRRPCSAVNSTQTLSSNSGLSTLHTSWHPTLQQFNYNRKHLSCCHHRESIFVFFCF